MCGKPVAAVFVLEPSPKSQNRFVASPVDVSVKFTVSGFKPWVGLAEKLAASGTKPTPVIALVLFPPSLAIVMKLLELPPLLGLNLTTRLVEPAGGRVKGVPEMILKGPAPTVA